MGNIEIGKRIEFRRKQLELTLDDVASEIGVAKSTVQRYEKGTIEKIKLPVIEAIARVLDVDPAWLCCKTESMNANYAPLPSNVVRLPASRPTVPLVGQIACGTPILAEENIEGYVELPSHVRADYALTCKGDSMINAGIRDGDVVYIRQQAEVENGQIAAVMVDEGEATLKRFYRDGNTVTLIAENPAVPPMVFTGEDINRLRVIGLSVAYIHLLEK